MLLFLCRDGETKSPSTGRDFGVRLNLVERWFALISQRQIKRGTHRSALELECAIRQYLDLYNEDPKPFAWSKSADEILASVARFL